MVKLSDCNRARFLSMCTAGIQNHFPLVHKKVPFTLMINDLLSLFALKHKGNHVVWLHKSLLTLYSWHSSNPSDDPMGRLVIITTAAHAFLMSLPFAIGPIRKKFLSLEILTVHHHWVVFPHWQLHLCQPYLSARWSMVQCPHLMSTKNTFWRLMAF